MRDYYFDCVCKACSYEANGRAPQMLDFQKVPRKIYLTFKDLVQADLVHDDLRPVTRKLKQQLIAALERETDFYSLVAIEFQKMLNLCFTLEILKKPLDSIIFHKNK